MAQHFFKIIHCFTALIILIAPLEAAAQTWKKYVTTEGLHASYIANDNTYINLIFRPVANKWVVVFRIPIKGSLGTIKSRIGKSNGKEVQLTLAPDKYNTEYAADTKLTQIAFVISNDDIEKIQSSNYWILEAAGKQYRFPLTGTRAALDQAMQAISNDTLMDAQLDDANHAAAQAISDCDQQAGHPWDSQSSASGRAWTDMDGQVAVSSCESAMSDPNPSPRMMFQLARSYDKVGDARTFALMKEAAWEEDYPAAFNHLGIFYRDGEYTSKNPGRAARAFKRGFELGNIPSCHGLAILRRDAANTASERAASHSLLKSCADQNYPRSLVEYGKMVMDGEIDGVAQSEAQPYLELASDAGKSEASYAMATMFRDGVGVSASPQSYLHYRGSRPNRGIKLRNQNLAWIKAFRLHAKVYSYSKNGYFQYL